MGSLDSVVRLYKQLVPNPESHLQENDLRHLRVWLTDDVCPIAEEYSRLLTFREHASWVVSALRAGAQTPERQAIEAVDDALVRYARAVSGPASKRRLAKQLAQFYPPEHQIVEVAVRITGRGSQRITPRPAEVDVLGQELSLAAAMAGRPWETLVNPDDYFEPRQERVVTGTGESVQRGDMIVSITPELHPVGNFVVRCMLRRVEDRVNLLETVHQKVMRALSEKAHRDRHLSDIEAAWHALQAAYGTIRKTFQTGADNQLRDSCMIVVQVFAAFHASPDLAWLGISPEIIQQSVPHLRRRITHFRNGQMFERIAKAVDELKQLYVPLPRDSDKDKAIAAGWLVIAKEARQVFWEGRLLDCDWKKHSVPWSFLLTLAEKARLQAAVKPSDIYGDRIIGQSTMAMNAGRVGRLVPPSLRKLITPGGDTQTYRLNLESRRIHILE